jgi:protein O-GlcNAc transferase
MGVPTLTLDGETPAARQGVAILAPLDLDGFIATDHDDFVAKGRYWATHTDELSLLRASLRERWQQAPSRKAENVADGLEQAVRTMWQTWCSGQAQCSFQIAAEHTGRGGFRNS